MWLQAVEGILGHVDTSVVGKAADITTAIELVAEYEPDLFVTDAAGVEAGAPADFDHVTAAHQLVPAIKCVVLSADNDPLVIEAALTAGAVAYVLKNAHPDDLASAVRQAFAQSIYLAHSGVGVPASPATASTAAAAELTKRERQILCLVAEGHSNAQLARMLWVTEQTVKFHLSNVYRKIDAANRTEAARWAQLHGLLTTGDDLLISA